MRNLLFKELNLSIHPFFTWIFPLLLALLFFIPNWIFTIIFLYIFWLSAPQIFQGYNVQQDQAFLSTLPVSKKSIVHSKILAFIILELIHVGFSIIPALLHVLLYGSDNYVMNINPALFGAVFVIYATFNISFFPGYFRTAYRYGIPLIVGIITSLLVATFFELGTAMLPWLSAVMKSESLLIQLGILIGGIAIFCLVNLLTARWSYRNYRRIQ